MLIFMWIITQKTLNDYVFCVNHSFVLLLPVTFYCCDFWLRLWKIRLDIIE